MAGFWIDTVDELGAQKLVFLDATGLGSEVSPYVPTRGISGTVTAIIQSGAVTATLSDGSVVKLSGVDYQAVCGTGPTGQVVTSDNATGGVPLTASTGSAMYRWLESLEVSVAVDMTVEVKDDTGNLVAGPLYMSANETYRAVYSTEERGSPVAGNELEVVTSVSGDVMVAVATVERATQPSAAS